MKGLSGVCPGCINTGLSAAALPHLLASSYSSAGTPGDLGRKSIARAAAMRCREKLQSAGGCAGRVEIFSLLFLLLDHLGSKLQIHQTPFPFLPPGGSLQQFEVCPEVITWLFFLFPAVIIFNTFEKSG